jgi:hypothetical protein
MGDSTKDGDTVLSWNKSSVLLFGNISYTP